MCKSYEWSIAELYVWSCGSITLYTFKIVEYNSSGQACNKQLERMSADS